MKKPPNKSPKGKRDFHSKPGKPFKKRKPAPAKNLQKDPEKEGVRLNRYIASAGICSRREADNLIKMGVISINGKVVTEMGTRVMPGDKVKYGDQGLQADKMQYVLLNKPKDFITTASDPQGRRTVMELVKSACKERLFPVGRLDRNTTGLLLFTNDGYLAEKLMHPSKLVSKLYHVETYKAVSAGELEKLKSGVELDDGSIEKPDEASFVGKDRHQLGIKLHSGKNRVVRRMIESLGHNVKKLDRVQFAGLTKKDLPRGKFRHLTEKEISFLKML